MTFTLAFIFLVLVFWRPQDWLFPWLFGWPLLDVIAYLSLLSLLLEGQLRRLQFPRTPAVGLVIGLWIASLMSHVPHTYFQGILDTMPETFKPCFFMLLLLVVVTSPGRLRVILGGLVLLCGLMAVHALMQQRTGAGFAGQPPIMQFTPEKGWFSRSLFFGIFEDPNDLAQMFAAAIPLVFAVPRRMNLALLGICVMVAGLFYYALLSTHSRGGMIALLTTGGMMAFLMFPPRWMPFLAGMGLVGFLVFCGLQGAGALDMSARERVVFWGMANRAFKANPFFGLGHGMFWQVAKERAAHNAFVACYTELGLFGYWFWFGLLQAGVMGCWRGRLALPRSAGGESAYLRRAAGMALASIGGFSAGAYFLSRTFVFPYFVLFAVLHCTVLLIQQRLPEAHPRLLQWRRDILIWGTVSTLASVVYIYVSILLLNR